MHLCVWGEVFSNMPMNRKFVCKPLLPPHMVSLLRYRQCLPPCSHTAKYKEAPGLAWRPWAVLLSIANTLLIMVPLLSLRCSLTFLTFQFVMYGTWQLMNKKVPLFVFSGKAGILYILFFKEILKWNEDFGTILGAWILWSYDGLTWPYSMYQSVSELSLMRWRGVTLKKPFILCSPTLPIFSWLTCLIIHPNKKCRYIIIGQMEQTPNQLLQLRRVLLSVQGIPKHTPHICKMLQIYRKHIFWKSINTILWYPLQKLNHYIWNELITLSAYLQDSAVLFHSLYETAWTQEVPRLTVTKMLLKLSGNF